MSWIDLVLIVLALLGAVGGYREGFVMSVVSLLAIVVGMLLAFKLMGNVMLMLDARFEINESVLPFIAFTVVFVIVVIVVSLLGRVMKSVIHETLLGSVDHMLGAVVGVAKFIFMISIFIWILDYADIDLVNRWSDQSVVLRVISRVAPTIAGWIGKVFPAFSDLFGP